MKGFDDHLDNYGDPGGGNYPGEIWDGPGDDYYPGSGDEENEDAFFNVEDYDEAKAADDGITTDDFDNFPTGREFPS